MKFGENLQKLRKEKGISQEQLAEQLGVTRQSVSKWESGASYPEMDKIVAICNLFHCNLDSLINKDITEERNKKEASSVVKEIFEKFAEYIRKTIYLFEHKSFKDVVKMIAQIFIIICIILCLSIPFMLVKEMVVSLFYTGDNWFSIFFSKFWNFIFNALYAVFAIAIFFYIFKVKFLDGEEIVIEEVSKNSTKSEDVTNNMGNNESRKTKVIKIKRSEGFSLLDLLVKIITVCFKSFLLFFLIPVGIAVVMLIIGLVLLIVLIFRGLFLAGPILFILGIVIFSIVVLELILDFIFNLKFSKRRVIITILSSIVISSIGFGLSIWYFLNLNIIQGVPNSFQSSTDEEVYEMSDNFLIHFYDYGRLEFVEDDSLTKQVRVRIDYYPDINDVHLEEDNHELYLDYTSVNNLNMKVITDSVIDDLKKGEIHTYDQLNYVTMTVTTSRENIQKIKDNFHNYQRELYREDY